MGVGTGVEEGGRGERGGGEGGRGEKKDVEDGNLSLICMVKAGK